METTKLERMTFYKRVFELAKDTVNRTHYGHFKYDDIIEVYYKLIKEFDK